MQGVPRSLLLLAKFVLALVVTLLVTLAFLIAGGLISIVLTYQPHGGPNSASLDVVSLLLSYLRACYGMLPYAALTFLLVVVSRSAVVAVSGLILFMLAIELPLTALLPLLGKDYAQVAQFLPAGLAQAMNQQNYAAAHLPTTTLVSPFFVHDGVPDQQALALWIKHPGGYPAGYQPEFRAIVDRQGRVVVSSDSKAVPPGTLLQVRLPAQATANLQRVLAGRDNNQGMVRWKRQTTIAASLQFDGEQALSLPVEEALFRVAQEALSNVARHSHATTVHMQLVNEPDLVTLSIADNGQGFSPATTEIKGVGFLSMRERMQALGGDVDIESQPGKGTRVVAHCPRKLSEVEKGETRRAVAHDHST